ncbi:MAG: 2-amino-4-hydroxy-6-hydroxymethyldihydropteridine diphosphokinase [Myxococcota bacterium]
MKVVIVGLGSNLGSRAALLLSAIDLLAATPEVQRGPLSPAYVTEALEGIGPPYLNAAVRLETELQPRGLLERALEVERSLGRVRGGHFSPRTLDLDLLWAGEPVRDPPHLVVPHPGLPERTFALAPLLDVAPELEGRYGSRLRELGGRPAESRPLDEGHPPDDWDRMAFELGRSARAEGGPGQGPPPVATDHFVVPPPGLPAGYDEVERRVRALARSRWHVRRVALGPARDGGTSVYLIGAPRAPDQPE